ncbi:MAG: hypothetical protein AAF441_03735 [Pseudomonadota bacterium]
MRGSIEPAGRSGSAGNHAIGREVEREVIFRGRRFSAGPQARLELLEAANIARSAVLSGTRPGDLRWSHPARDFIWFDVDGCPVRMDAYTLLALATGFARQSEDDRLNRSLNT